MGYQPDHTTILKVSSDDMKTVARILASAFSNDPIMNWLSPNAEIYEFIFLAELEALYKHHNHVYINQAGTGAANWLPPGISHSLGFHWLEIKTYINIFKSTGFEGLKRARQLENSFKEHHIKEPHYYLNAVGASMGNQGKGIGSALLKAGLDECDKHRMPAYLESSNEKNNPLYQRFGFEIIDEVKIDATAPPYWPMRREARA